MKKSLLDHYRCPEQFLRILLGEPVPEKVGYFSFQGNVLYGRALGVDPADSPDGQLGDVIPDFRGHSVLLPFDLTEVVDGLRKEMYGKKSDGLHPAASIRGRLYYFFRPLLPVRVRRHLQRIRLNGWNHLPFPHWPVDRTVDNTLEAVLRLTLRAQNRQEIPFIWFWPSGASSCAIMTHDVETTAGRDFCSALMDVNDSYGVKASFQVVPEERYDVPQSYLSSIRDRGFEVNVQDLNHDGHLFRSKKQFLERARKINHYGREFGAEGFRSAVLYRRQDWYDALDFSYDTSVPNVAHLDPQRGGCCTTMPYFVGNIVELPVTMTQDYSLFHILNSYTIDLWRKQIELIMEKHGLINFIVHPDYITAKEEMATYKELLRYLTRLAAEKNIWMPLPREVASWWRDRASMKLVEVDGHWQIEGKGSERARIAYASETDGQVVYSFQSVSQSNEVGVLASRRT